MLIINDPSYTTADRVFAGFLLLLITVCGLLLFVGVPIGLYYSGLREDADRSACESRGMTMTDIRQGSGKHTTTLHVCRAENGQLYSF